MGGLGIREESAFVQKSDRVELDNLMFTTVRDFVNKLFLDTQNGVMVLELDRLVEAWSTLKS